MEVTIWSLRLPSIRWRMPSEGTLRLARYCSQAVVWRWVESMMTPSMSKMKASPAGKA